MRQATYDSEGNEKGTVRMVEAVLVTEARAEARAEAVAIESRLDVRVDGEPWAEFMLSPRDLEDFVYGALFVEGTIERAADVRAVRIERAGERHVAEVCLARAEKRGAAEVEGELADESELADEAREGALAASPRPLDPAAIFAVSRSLLSRQGMHRATGATHAALFAGFDGTIQLVREDVGRHNAVDKLVGALLRAGVDPDAGFVYLSSRCALELVMKVARYGVRIVATVSAPTSAVLDFAVDGDVTLCAFAREGRFTVYTHPERIAL